MRILALKSLDLTWLLSPNLSIYFNFARCRGKLWYNHVRRFSVHSRFIEKSMYSIYIMYCYLEESTSKSGKWSTIIIAHSQWTQLFLTLICLKQFSKPRKDRYIFLLNVYFVKIKNEHGNVHLNYFLFQIFHSIN